MEIDLRVVGVALALLSVFGAAYQFNWLGLRQTIDQGTVPYGSYYDFTLESQVGKGFLTDPNFDSVTLRPKNGYSLIAQSILGTTLVVGDVNVYVRHTVTGVGVSFGVESNKVLVKDGSHVTASVDFRISKDKLPTRLTVKNDLYFKEAVTLPLLPSGYRSDDVLYCTYMISVDGKVSASGTKCNTA